MEAIDTLRHKFGSSGLFGNEKDQSFKSSINTIYQTFGGEDYKKVLRKRLQCYYIWLLKIILLVMVTKELQLFFSCGF